MIPSNRDLHPMVRQCLFETGNQAIGRRGHMRAGLFDSTAILSPDVARYKGGGGVGGIIKSVIVGAVVGAITGGIGFYAMPALGFELAAGATFWGSVAAGAVMGGIGAGLSGSASGLAEVRQ